MSIFGQDRSQLRSVAAQQERPNDLVHDGLHLRLDFNGHSLPVVNPQTDSRVHSALIHVWMNGLA